MTRSILLLAIVALTLAGAGPAAAACTAPPDTRSALEEASVVFVGKVLTTTPDGQIATLQVLSIWKGRDLPQQVEVTGGGGSSEDGFIVGSNYLVVPENSRPPFLAGECSATQTYDDPSSVIPVAYQSAVGDTLGRSPAASSQAEEAADTNAFRTVAFGIVAAGVIAVGLLTLRMRQPLERTAMADEVTEEAIQQGDSQQKRRRRPSSRRRSRSLAKARSHRLKNRNRHT